MLNDICSLSISTATVFSLCATKYVDEDYHWGDDCDILQQYIPPTGHILDIGCGPGWHINWILSETQSSCFVTGVDKSKEMLSLAKQHTTSHSRRVTLLNQDIVDRSLLLPKCDLLLCLNNTLGNIYHDKHEPCSVRLRALMKMYCAMRAGGTLLVSVYRRDKLDHRCTYGRMFLLNQEVSNLDKGDLIVNYCDPPNTPPAGIAYYSHWFTKDELSNMIAAARFHDIKIIEKECRFIAVAKK